MHDDSHDDSHDMGLGHDLKVLARRGATLQLATISGDATNGFVATLTVAV